MFVKKGSYLLTKEITKKDGTKMYISSFLLEEELEVVKVFADCRHLKPKSIHDLNFTINWDSMKVYVDSGNLVNF